MRLNHLNLTVTDVLEASAFLETYFGLESMGGNAGMAVLTDGQGFILTLMKGGKASPVSYPSTFHVGFFVEGESSVDALNARLRADGYEIPPAERNNHAYGFYVQAPGGFTVEVGA